MSPSQLNHVLQTAIPARQNVMIFGCPGIGKTDLVKQATMQIGADLIVIHAVTMDVTDVKGLPAFDSESKVASWHPFGMLKQLIKAKKPLVCFLDDFSQANHAVQAGFMQIIHAGHINEHKISDQVVFIAAANRQKHFAAANNIISTLISRFHIVTDLEISIPDWTPWALINKVNLDIINYIRFKGPQALLNFDPAQKDKPFPCPRSITFASEILEQNYPTELLQSLVAGATGAGWAAEFFQFKKMAELLPPIEQILTNPKSVKLPQNSPGIEYAVASALSNVASKNNFKAVIEASKTLLKPEFQISCVLDAVRRNFELSQCRPYVVWAAENAKFLA